MSNGPARALNVDKKLQESGELIADPYEVSLVRREGMRLEAHCSLLNV